MVEKSVPSDEKFDIMKINNKWMILIGVFLFVLLIGFVILAGLAAIGWYFFVMHPQSAVQSTSGGTQNIDGCWGQIGDLVTYDNNFKFQTTKNVVVEKLNISQGNIVIEYRDQISTGKIEVVGGKTVVTVGIGVFGNSSKIVEYNADAGILSFGGINYTRIQCDQKVGLPDATQAAKEAAVAQTLGCASNQIVCDSSCKTPTCTQAGDCSTQTGFEAACSNPNSCSAECVQTPITKCANGDGFCPENCSILNDNDCKAYGLNQPVQINSEITLTLSNPSDKHCVSKYSDYGSYLAISAKFENTGTKRSDYIFPGNFYVLDSPGTKYTASVLTGLYDTNCYAPNDAINDAVQLMPGQTKTEAIWFKVLDDGDYQLKGNLKIIYTPNSNPFASGGEKVFAISR